MELIVHVNPEARRERGSIRSPRLRRPHRHVEDAGPEAGAGQVRLRRRVRRRAARRGEVARQGAHLLVPQRRSIAGIRRTSGRSCGASTTRASTRARASACFRSRTGPSSTSGSTSTWRTSRSCRSTSRRRGRWSSATARCIMVDDERMPLHARARQPMMRKVRFRTLGCYPLTGAVEIAGGHAGRRSSQEMLLTTHVRARRAASSTTTRPRRWRRRSRRGTSDVRDVSDLIAERTSTRYLERTSTRACCASSPAAASTTARAR